MAFSGEVEDSPKTQNHPPTKRGNSSKETSGPQVTKQTATVAFTARGEHKYQRTQAVIDETVAPYIVDKMAIVRLMRRRLLRRQSDLQDYC